MDNAMRLLLCMFTAFGMFCLTMAVYTVGITLDLCTWSTQLVTIVGLNDLMVAAVLWMFWD
jgi:hypothetical protein